MARKIQVARAVRGHHDTHRQLVQIIRAKRNRELAGARPVKIAIVITVKNVREQAALDDKMKAASAAECQGRGARA